MLGAENIEMHSTGISFKTRKAAIASGGLSPLCGKDLKLFNRFGSGIISRFTALPDPGLKSGLDDNCSFPDVNGALLRI